jgi:rRNA-processing protein FCF1
MEVLVAVVIDTNCLISHLAMLESFLKIIPSNVTICLPSVVIRELDGLKENENQVTSRAARMASNFLLDAMLSSSKIQGQNAQQRASRNYFINNDDEIIEYCVYINRNITPNVVVLSQDRNLCIKASMNGCKPIPSLDNISGEQLLEIINKKQYEYHTEMYVEELDSFKEISRPQTTMEVEMAGPHSEFQLSEVLLELNDVLVGCLSTSIKRVAASQNSSANITSLSTLSDIASVLKANYVWGIQLPPIFTTLAPDITRSVRQNKTLLTIGDLQRFISDIPPVLEICNLAGLPNDMEKAKMLLERINGKLNYFL